MTEIQKLQQEIDQLEKKRDDALAISGRYVGSGEDGFTDPEVEAASNESERLGREIEAKRKELKKLKDENLPDDFVGLTQG